MIANAHALSFAAFAAPNTPPESRGKTCGKLGYRKLQLQERYTMASLWLLVFLAAAVEGSSAFAIAGVMSPTACSSATCSCLLWPTPHFLRSAEPPSHRGAWHMTLDAGVDWSDKVVEAAKKKAVELVVPVIPYIQSTYIHSCIHACIHSQHF